MSHVTHMHVNEGLMLGHMRLMFDLISTPFQSPRIPLFLKCCVYTGLGFHSEEYILDQIHKISKVSEVLPLPPSPCVSPHNLGSVWQFKTCISQSLQISGTLQPLSHCEELLALLHYCRSVQEACSLIYYNKFRKVTCTTYHSAFFQLPLSSFFHYTFPITPPLHF